MKDFPTYTQAIRWAAQHAAHDTGVIGLIAFIYNKKVNEVGAKISERIEFKIIDHRKYHR